MARVAPVCLVSDFGAGDLLRIGDLAVRASGAPVQTSRRARWVRSKATHCDPCYKPKAHAAAQTRHLSQFVSGGTVMRTFCAILVAASVGTTLATPSSGAVLSGALIPKAGSSDLLTRKAAAEKRRKVPVCREWGTYDANTTRTCTRVEWR